MAKKLGMGSFDARHDSPTESTVVEHAGFASLNVSILGIQSSLVDRPRKGDEGTPVCGRCERSGRWCDKTGPLKIRVQKNVGGQKGDRNKINGTVTVTEVDEELRVTLQSDQTAQLFEHYLKVLACWYDLNDFDCSFARIVGREAQHSDLLLNAVLAFSAMHKCRTGQSSLKGLAESYHARCLRLLIRLQQSDQETSDGTALAATCLLRSYEILAGEWSGQVRAREVSVTDQLEEDDPNRHLFGAFSLLPDLSSTLPSKPLLLAGLWNYLREDITFALINRYPLKTNIGSVRIGVYRDDDYASQITLLLARVINKVFLDIEDDGVTLRKELSEWRSSLPFEPYHETSQDEGFPRILMIHVCQGGLVMEDTTDRADIDSRCVTILPCRCDVARQKPHLNNRAGPACADNLWACLVLEKRRCFRQFIWSDLLQ
ncbi:uncharacterized protein A1O9_11686 [Exophiala aquamarina CBS 119918]|uniref:Zn(2)-C6 fungal-type domain-containing protein n=1 Tax=Exophiala aquamarina CBS 119918 TaxID=1182545 RepID=A0A072PA50_9EURO|nr:uncharacterized protein A1O9_11686 [Exophiala aquamarina CBS 119918]KEF52445.1 hypothetical protein A1O9_11686 [Exophiala aquamarina CBS 119918]